MKRLITYRPTRADVPDLAMVAIATVFIVALVARIVGGFL